MNKALLILSFMFTAISSNAQTFTPSPSNFFESTNHVDDWVSDYLYLNNNTGASMNLRYQTLSNTLNSIGWDVSLCTNLDCHNFVPSSGTLGTIADGASGHLNVHVGFMGIPGTGEIRIRVYEYGNTSNADTLTFRYHATITTALSGFSENNKLALSQNYPNPFSATTSISYNIDTPTGRLVITDALGKNVINYDLSSNSGEVIITEKLKSGIYSYSLYNSNKVISTRNMIVK
jgi:hypothetical protein